MASSLPLTKLELHFQCDGLKNLDRLSKSDPQVYVHVQDPRTKQWIEVGKTEMIRDNLNPKFANSVLVDYYFEEVQNMQFFVVDVDKPGKGMDQQELIGVAQCSLASIVGSRGSQVIKDLISKTKKRTGSITVTAEEVKEMKMAAKIQLCAKHLDKKDFFGKSDPFLAIHKAKNDNTWIKVHETEVVMKTLDPTWKPMQLSLQKICNGDMNRGIMIECFDWNKSGTHELIGKFTTTMAEMKEKKSFSLLNPKKQGKKGYTDSGTIEIVSIELTKEHSFLDYVVGGCEISLVVAVDFTASNGDPRFANSLHYRNPYQPNEYEQAIMSVGEILACYDTDGNFPVYGFGAIVPWMNNSTSHCFPLNGNFNNPEVPGISGILDSYRRSLDTVRLYGPTNFSAIINTAAFIASRHCSQDNQRYLILLILTDGEITDMDNTIKEIVQASSLPMSIIIVGVGGADFEKMNALDADVNPLQYGVQRAERDIVQFVPFRDFKGNPQALAAATLAEVPAQLVGWMNKHKIIPLPPRTAPAPSTVVVPQPNAPSLI